MLALACSAHIVLPLTQDAVQSSLGVECGNWLWRKLWKQRGDPGETTFHLTLIPVIEFVNKNPSQAPAILEAFDHDVTFHTSLDDSSFFFHFNSLSNEAQKVLKPFMVAFYEELLADGFEEAVHGHSTRLDRDGFISSFWRTSPALEVCPACDEKRSDVIGDKHFDDADHFLPKSKYPFLSVHHQNLVPMCLACNRSFKLDRDPVDDHSNAPLTNTFHPYERPALEYMDVVVYRDHEGVPLLEFQDRESVSSRRIESLKRVFRLHDRWPDHLRYQIGVLRDEVANAGRRWKLDANLTEVDLQDELREMLRQRQEKRGRRVGYVLQASYLTYALNNSDEFQTLFREFAGD